MSTDICISPSSINASIQCNNQRIGESLHCEIHAGPARKLYSQYKSAQASVDSIITNLGIDGDIYTYFSIYSRLSEEMRLRGQHRAKFVMPEFYDKGHDFYVTNRKGLIETCKKHIEEYFSQQKAITSEKSNIEESKENENENENNVCVNGKSKRVKKCSKKSKKVNMDISEKSFEEMTRMIEEEERLFDQCMEDIRKYTNARINIIKQIIKYLLSLNGGVNYTFKFERYICVQGSRQKVDEYEYEIDWLSFTAQMLTGMFRLKAEQLIKFVQPKIYIGYVDTLNELTLDSLKMFYKELLTDPDTKTHIQHINKAIEKSKNGERLLIFIYALRDAGFVAVLDESNIDGFIDLIEEDMRLDRELSRAKSCKKGYAVIHEIHRKIKMNDLAIWCKYSYIKLDIDPSEYF